MKCEICNSGPLEGKRIWRVNELGVKGIWRCDEHLNEVQKEQFEESFVEIVDIISGK